MSFCVTTLDFEHLFMISFIYHPKITHIFTYTREKYQLARYSAPKINLLFIFCCCFSFIRDLHELLTTSLLPSFTFRAHSAPSSSLAILFYFGSQKAKKILYSYVAIKLYFRLFGLLLSTPIDFLFSSFIKQCFSVCFAICLKVIKIGFHFN